MPPPPKQSWVLRRLCKMLKDCGKAWRTVGAHERYGVGLYSELTALRKQIREVAATARREEMMMRRARLGQRNKHVRRQNLRVLRRGASPEIPGNPGN